MFLKKTKECKGFLITKENGRLTNIDVMYPTEAGALLDSIETMYNDFKYVDGNQFGQFVVFDKLDDQTNVYQAPTLVNRVKQVWFS